MLLQDYCPNIQTLAITRMIYEQINIKQVRKSLEIPNYVCFSRIAFFLWFHEDSFSIFLHFDQTKMFCGIDQTMKGGNKFLDQLL